MFGKIPLTPRYRLDKSLLIDVPGISEGKLLPAYVRGDNWDEDYDAVFNLANAGVLDFGKEMTRWASNIPNFECKLCPRIEILE